MDFYKNYADSISYKNRYRFYNIFMIEYKTPINSYGIGETS